MELLIIFNIIKFYYFESLYLINRHLTLHRGHVPVEPLVPGRRGAGQGASRKGPGRGPCQPAPNPAPAPHGTLCQPKGAWPHWAIAWQEVVLDAAPVQLRAGDPLRILLCEQHFALWTVCRPFSGTKAPGRPISQPAFMLPCPQPGVKGSLARRVLRQRRA